MVTRSGAEGNLPPAVGVITDRVIAKRPDLDGMMGFTVRLRAPSKLDIASVEGRVSGYGWILAARSDTWGTVE